MTPESALERSAIFLLLAVYVVVQVVGIIWWIALLGYMVMRFLLDRWYKHQLATL